MATSTLILTAVGSVFLLLFLVMKARLHAFLALILVSIGAGLFAGMPLVQITETMQKGMAGTLGFLAIVVALGAMFGKILHETGALDQIATKLLSVFGVQKAHYAVGIAGLVCALPLFFDVAIVLLIGMVFAVARQTGGNVVKMAVPLFAGVAAAAAFLVPGPTPMLVASQMGADFGWMMMIGLFAAMPAMLIAGPIFGQFISRHVHIDLPPNEEKVVLEGNQLPSFGFSLALVLFPLCLVGLNTIGVHWVNSSSGVTIAGLHYTWHSLFQFIGHPFIALLAACLVAIYGLAIRRGMSKDQIMDICSSAIQPAGIILLVTGAGGVFKQILIDSKVGPALGEMLIGAGLPIALACFVLSAGVRVIQGSATVACLTAVGLILPVVNELGLTGAQLAALSICISGGSIVLSHVNDSGFWLYGKFTGATELQTLKTWSLMETILGTIGGMIGVIAFTLLSP